MGLNTFIENWYVIERAWTYADNEEREMDGTFAYGRVSTKDQTTANQWLDNSGLATRWIIGISPRGYRKSQCKPAPAFYESAWPDSERGDACRLKAGSPRA